MSKLGIWFSAGLWPVALAACTPAPLAVPQTLVQTRIEYVQPSVPAALQGCPSDPDWVAKPHLAHGDPHGASKVAVYVAHDDKYKADLLGVADVCRATLAALNQYLAAGNKGTR